MTPGIFITGTNTGVGKTAVAVAILRLLAAERVQAVGLKPVASGGVRQSLGQSLQNLDALELQAAASVALPYMSVNPYCFEPAIAPHLAARDVDQALPLAALVDWYHRATAQADLSIVEGAGGWRVPLHPTGFMSDLPEALGLGVILILGTTLGCLNHARLTFEAIGAGGRARWLGWIANDIDPAFQRRADNLATLASLLEGPPLALARWTGTRSAFDTAVLELDDDAPLRQVLRAAVRA